MSKPRLLDLFCGAGGAARGYQLAGFYVIGVDINPQPRYAGDEFIQADAMTYPLDGFDAIHASPPCQGYSVSKGMATGDKPLLIAQVRSRLRATGKPWVLENVAGAWRDLPAAVMLCGTHFGLKVYRHRLFESSDLLFSPGQCTHPRHLMDGYLCVYGSNARRRQTGNKGNCYQRVRRDETRDAMGIDWMTMGELAQAIPPAYTLWLGRQLLAAIEHSRTAA